MLQQAIQYLSAIHASHADNRSSVGANVNIFLLIAWVDANYGMHHGRQRGRMIGINRCDRCSGL